LLQHLDAHQCERHMAVQVLLDHFLEHFFRLPIPLHLYVRTINVSVKSCLAWPNRGTRACLSPTEHWSSTTPYTDSSGLTRQVQQYVLDHHQGIFVTACRDTAARRVRHTPFHGILARQMPRYPTPTSLIVCIHACDESSNPLAATVPTIPPVYPQ
jgi:hypothetical protein